MALIKCSNCQKDVSDKSKKCIHCGAKIHSVSINKNSNVNTNTSANTNISTEYNNTYATRSDTELFKNIISILLSLILIFMIFEFEVVKTRYSGDYSVIESLFWLIRNELGIMLSANLQDLLKLFVVVYILACMVLCCLKNKSLNAIGKAGYIVMFVIEILFLLIIQFDSWTVNFNYFILIAYTLGLIIYSFKFNNSVINEVSINPKNDDVKINNSFDSYEEIKKLKELLDMNAITEKEFNEMKKTILEKEKEKILK